MEHDDTVESGRDDEGGSTHVGGRIGPFQIDGLLGSGGMGVVLAGRDPDLNRTVAIKVLNAGSDRERLIREAQAMARVAHPNTIAVYEIGRAGDEIFIAMERVHGTSLRAWLRAEPRTWREIVTMFIAAGRGLAAVHAAGLVHRDFKPDNVMVRTDGRPQVGDFGLAATDAPPVVDDASGSLDKSTTLHGKIAGTPAVMAPEQWRGEAVDARADQFAFSVSLWVALFGEHPFPTDDYGTLRDAVLAGRRKSRRPSVVPDRVVAALERGLALDPAARWPSLDDLLARLESGLGVRRRRAIAAGLVAAAAGTAAIGAYVLAPAVSTDPCPAPTAQIAAVWDAARVRALRAHLLAVDPAGGAARLDAIERVVAPFAAGWREIRIDTCRATRVRGEQSDTTLDLRVRCLDSRLAEIAASLRYVASADTPSELDDAQRGLLGTSPVSVCREDELLAQVASLPTDPVARATAEDVDARMTDIEAAYRAAQVTGLEVRLKDALEDARKSGHAHTLAHVLVTASDVADAEGNHAVAEAHAREATQVAAASGDASLEARAWLTLVTQLSRTRSDEALALMPAASAAVVRGGNQIDQRAKLLARHASLHSRRGDVRLAGEKLAEARRLIEAVPDRPPYLEVELAGVFFEMGNNAAEQGDDDLATKNFRDAIEVYRRVMGDDSTLEGGTWHAIAETHWSARRFDEAVAANSEAIRIVKARIGPSATLAFYTGLRALILDDVGRSDDALAAYQDAVTMFRTYVGPDNSSQAAVLIGYASALSRAERVAEAEAIYDQVIALFERTRAQTVNLPIAIFNRAELGRRQARCSDVIPHYQRAAALFRELNGADTPYQVYPLVAEASCRVTIGQPLEAIPLLERVLARPAEDALRTAMAKAWLGRALVESRRDPRKGMAMARTARAAMAAITNDVEAPGELRELDRWLSARGQASAPR